MNLSKYAKATRVINATAAGTSTVTGATIDQKSFDSCLFVVGFGAIVSGAATSIKVQSGAASDMSDAADLLGTGITVTDTDDNKIVLVEVTSPRERYVRVIVLRATQNSTVDFGIALQGKAKSEPTTHDSTTVIGAEHHLAPSEGVA